MSTRLRFNQIRAFVFAIVLVCAVGSYAEENCFKFLSQALTSSDGLTKQSQQYLRLIEYALEKTTENSEKQSLLQSIKMATLVPGPINVFRHQTGVLGAKLQQTVDRMGITQSLSADWARVQQRLKEILGRYVAQGEAREQSERETDWVGVIDQAWKMLLTEI